MVCQRCKIDKVYTHTTVQRKTGLHNIVRDILTDNRAFHLRREFA